MAWAATAEGGGVKYGLSESLRVLLGAEADKIAGANPNLALAAVASGRRRGARKSGPEHAGARQAAVKPTVDDEAAKKGQRPKTKARTQDSVAGAAEPGQRHR